MSISCTRRIQFCAGHRVHGHENKCANLHGHNYVALITAQMYRGLIEGDGDHLDELGRVIDFSVLKERVGGWIDKHWDHGFILWQDDVPAINKVGGLPRQKIHLMPDNPTAENMARFLLDVVCKDVLADTNVVAVEVTLWETENCFATVRAS